MSLGKPRKKTQLVTQYNKKRLFLDMKKLEYYLNPNSVVQKTCTNAPKNILSKSWNVIES